MLLLNDYLISGCEDNHLYIHNKNNYELLSKIDTKNSVHEIIY